MKNKDCGWMGKCCDRALQCENEENQKKMAQNDERLRSTEKNGPFLVQNCIILTMN